MTGPMDDGQHAKFSKDQTRAGFTLARMRNAVSSRFNTLPKEIISEIFLDVVYSPSPTDNPNPSMLNSLETIFTRVDNLLSVCSWWKDIGLSLGALWYFPPMADSKLARPARRTASISLQRISVPQYDNRLYLAAILPSCYNAINFPAPNGRAPQFNAINIQARSITGTVNLLSSVIQSQAPEALSELSIYHYHIGRERYVNHPQDFLIDFFTGSQKQRLIDLIGSLSVLRIRKVNIRWDEIAFSNRLVSFHLEAVSLGNYSQLIGLLQTLQSAPELRELKFRTVFAFPEPLESGPARIVFSKLHSLYLENLDFGVLQVIIDSVVPGSHKRALYLTSQAAYVHMPAVEAELIDFQRLVDLLKRSKIDNLLVDGYYRELWISGSLLRIILESLPSLVAFQSMNCNLKEEHLQALERPKTRDDSSQSLPLPFPSLTQLSLVNTSIEDMDALKLVVESHRIQSMILSSNVTTVDRNIENDSKGWRPSHYYTFTDEDQIVQWLKGAVPKFNLVDETWGAKHDLRHVIRGNASNPTGDLAAYIEHTPQKTQGLSISQVLRLVLVYVAQLLNTCATRRFQKNPLEQQSSSGKLLLKAAMSVHWWPDRGSAQPAYECDMQRSEISIEQELAGLLALKIISQTSSEIQSQIQPNSNTSCGDASVLHSALALAQDPATIRHLSDPDIVSGCIKLMTTVKDKRSISPFSSEVGWLSLRLLVIALNICLLERYDRLEETLALFNQRHDIRAAPHILASAHLSYGITTQLSIIDTGGDCDWVFGWSVSPFGRQTCLLPASEALALLNVLWEDRKLFMRSLYSCHPNSLPGLCALLFMFARSLVHLRPQLNQDVAIPESRLHELAIRYLLVADRYQCFPTVRICESSPKTFFSTWPRAPKHVDAEDSQTMMTAFIRQLTASDKVDILEGREPFMMLQLIPFAIHPEAQSLIPEVMHCIMKYGWCLTLSSERQSNKALGFEGAIFDALRMIIRPVHSQPYHLELGIQQRVIDVLHDQDFLDLAARIIIRLDPRPDPAATKRTLVSIFEFSDKLYTTVKTKDNLEKCFRHYAPEWWKIHRYILFTGYAGVDNPRADDYEHYDSCIKTWGVTSRLLGIDSQISHYQGVKCYNDRCALAYTCTYTGTRFMCGECERALYCDDRCQSMDWTSGESGGHRAVCNPCMEFK
ncbi:unnamed protein product [Rhizoctonia solani]|nr:unnamed protein product [Rhizoctonia solani]